MTNPQARAGWQPIDTAPRDGTSVLLYEPFEWALEAGFWDRDDGEWRPHSNRGHFWKQPTHWMSLPAEPSACEAPQVES